MILKMFYILKVFHSFNIILQNNTKKIAIIHSYTILKETIVSAISEDNKLNIYKISIG